MNYSEYLGIKLYLSDKPIKHWLFHENEFWKDIQGYEGMYMISTLGRVKSLSREKICKNGRVIKIEEKIRILSKDPYYSILSLPVDRKSRNKTFKVHKLVMDTFIGKSNLVVNHKDGNKQNNRLSNFEYCTNHKNLIHYHKAHPKTSKFTGVCWDKNRQKWRASMRLNDKWVSLGRHETEIGAYVVRLKHEMYLFANNLIVI